MFSQALIWFNSWPKQLPKILTRINSRLEPEAIRFVSALETTLSCTQVWFSLPFPTQVLVTVRPDLPHLGNSTLRGATGTSALAGGQGGRGGVKGVMQPPWVSFRNGRRTAGRIALKLCIAYETSLAQFPAIKNWRGQTRVRFHQIQVSGYDAISWKIWPMGCQIGCDATAIWYSIGQIFQDFASYPRTWIWWNRTQVTELWRHKMNSLWTNFHSNRV